MTATLNEVINSLQYHKLDMEDPEGQSAADSFDDLRMAAIDFARMIEANCPDGREKSLAFTHLEETLMWAIKSIAIRMD